jgi:replicative DNA helicase
MENNDGMSNSNSMEYEYVRVYSSEAEQSLLGAVILDSSCLSEVIPILSSPDCFYMKNNKLIYSVMTDMYSSGEAIDIVTLLDNLQKKDEFDKESGKVYLTELGQQVPSITNVKRYAEIIKEKYDLRRLISASRITLQECGEGNADAYELIDAAEQRLFDIRKDKKDELVPIRDAIVNEFDYLDRITSPDADLYRGIPTGISKLDEITTGLNRSDLIILAARPGVGKTSFSLNIAENAALKKNKKIAFFSLEMTAEQLAARMLSTEALVDNTKLRTGFLDSSEWSRLIEAADILRKAEIYFDDTSAATVPTIKAKVRRMKDVDLIIIDYLQLMTSPKRTENRVQEIQDITRNLKIMAKEIDVPVVVLSQLARESVKRTSHRPMLSDLRDSGAIEQDADIVIFLYRDGGDNGDNVVDQNDPSAGQFKCAVAKNRHGKLDEVDLHWQGEFTKFTAEEYVHNEE